MKYVELAYEVPSEHAERAAEILVEVGASGIEERDASTIDKPRRGHVALVTWIAPDEVERFIGRVAAVLAPLVGAEAAQPARRERDEDEWRDAWKRYFHARPIGRFVIVPSWESYVPKAGEVVLDLDPGRAFGTGGHASTRLCLTAIDSIAGTPGRVLDVGCGSGVLAIAAARRWPSLTGLGVDVDPDAIEVSRENAARNRVADRLRFATTPIARVDEQADLVLANIQPEILIPMAAVLRARLSSKASLVLAGIVDEAAEDVVAAYAGQGLPSPTRFQEEGWTALMYRMNP